MTEITEVIPIGKGRGKGGKPHAGNDGAFSSRGAPWVKVKDGKGTTSGVDELRKTRCYFFHHATCKNGKTCIFSS